MFFSFPVVLGGDWAHTRAHHDDNNRVPLFYLAILKSGNRRILCKKTNILPRDSNFQIVLVGLISLGSVPHIHEMRTVG